MIHPEQHYLDIFQVDLPRMDALVAEALRHGGDYCDLYFENTTYGNLVLRDGAVASGAVGGRRHRQPQPGRAAVHAEHLHHKQLFEPGAALRKNTSSLLARSKIA